MPIYEFKCLQCENEFEKLVYGTNNRKISCPGCSSEDVEKKFSVFGMKTSSGFTSSATGSNCGGCSSSSCASCH
ncbi:MAG: zinc ribbon domain-containing protein [Candidatus Tectomicrobia bacterium]|uniref:Zinc ribbon domain-containing protein n=1 Tax=Tectimicrobiota bacterium TaxID=2528274 RepID=A0A933GPD3_UNCTE|nr:zinc ribbon domain-containing protein [Candidatus Tectomicrobia bacterium]